MRFLIVSAKCIAAGSLIATGTFLLLVPAGPALIAAGIAILATEFVWAEEVQQRAVALWQRVWHEPPVVDFSVEVQH